MIDIVQAFHQLGLSAKSRKYCAFATANKHLQLTRMAMGLQMSPAVFQRFICQVLGPLIGVCCFPYQDDVLVYSDSVEAHLRDLEKVISALSSYGLHGKLSKTSLFCSEVNYLGHIVTADGIRPDPEKVAALKAMEFPKNVSEVRTLIGFSNWLKKFVPELAQITAPITDLLKVNGQSSNGKLDSSTLPKSVMSSFAELKRVVSERTTLIYLDFNRPFFPLMPQRLQLVQYSHKLTIMVWKGLLDFGLISSLVLSAIIIFLTRKCCQLCLL